VRGEAPHVAPDGASWPQHAARHHQRDRDAAHRPHARRLFPRSHSHDSHRRIRSPKGWGGFAIPDESKSGASASNVTAHDRAAGFPAF
jgi:hypothetical protein